MSWELIVPIVLAGLGALALWWFTKGSASHKTRTQKKQREKFDEARRKGDSAAVDRMLRDRL